MAQVIQPADYFIPVRDAASEIADLLSASGGVDREELRAALMKFAHAILDSAREEAMIHSGFVDRVSRPGRS